MSSHNLGITHFESLESREYTTVSGRFKLYTEAYHPGVSDERFYNTKTKQTGELIDKSGTNIGLVNWKNSDTQTLEDGKEYTLKDISIVPSGDWWQFICRSNTTVMETTIPSNAVEKYEQNTEIDSYSVTCPNCNQTGEILSGPENPELGWDYFYCSNCDTTKSPQEVQ